MTDRREYPREVHLGARRLGVVTFAVITLIGALGLVASIVASFVVPDLTTTSVAAAIVTGVGALGFVWMLAQRRAYLRAVRNGDVQVPGGHWTPDTPHTW